MAAIFLKVYMEQLLFPTLAACISAFATWLLSKRKNLALDRAAELDNAVNAVKYYREMLDDMAGRLSAATDTIRAMEVKHKELMLVNQHLVDELQKFKQLNGKLQ